MSKKWCVITTINLLLCVTVLGWFSSDKVSIDAQGQNQFLGPVYYDSRAVNSVFDHDLPINNPDLDPDNNDFVRHYDGTRHDPPFPNGWGYDGHEGIDYALSYREVLAAADGEVTEAGWDHPDNHELAYGLLVVIDHSDYGHNFTTYYGHLSVVLVRAEDTVTVDPENWEGVIAISGSTGRSSGPHLHFGVHNANNRVVNPYGWIGAIEDPWANDPNGATSVDLWTEYPNITGNQFGDGPGVARPDVNDLANLVIDDSSADFTLSGECWIPETAGDPQDSFNGTYYWAIANDDPECVAEWQIKPDTFSAPGLYDVFVYIPRDSSASIDSLYTINYSGGTGMAEIIPFHYHDNQPPPDPPNNPDDTINPWAYIGRYEFAMDGTETIQLNDDVPAEPPIHNRHVLADAIKLVAVTDVQPSASIIYYSWAHDGVIGDVADDQANIITYNNEDIVAYDTLNGTWSIYFDGSDVGLADVNVDAFTMLADESILLSVDEPLEGLGELEKVDDVDIVRFIPTSTGTNTAGSYELYFDGSSHDLDDPGLGGLDNDIDAIGFAPTGELLISTVNSFFEPLIGDFDDEDLVYWDTSGIVPGWVVYFDGSDVGLTTTDEDVNGVWIDESGEIFVTTLGTFDTSTLSGDGADIFICNPASTGGNTTCTYITPLYWNGSAHGNNTLPEGMSVPPYYPPLILDGFFLPAYSSSNPPSSCGPEPLNCSFEDGLNHWTVFSSTPVPPDANWSSTNIDAYAGQYSAKMSVTDFPIEYPFLFSSVIAVESTSGYRFSFSIREINHDYLGLFGLYWGNGNGTNEMVVEDTPQVIDSLQTGWQTVTSSFYCPPQGATVVQMWFSIHEVYSVPHTVLFDEVTIEVQPDICP